MLLSLKWKNTCIEGTVKKLTACLTCLPLLLCTYNSFSHADDAGAKLSKKEKAQMVEQSVTEYQKGDHASALRRLEQAASVFSTNYAVPYYLGLIYLEQDRKAAAVFQWQRYVEMDPDSENAMVIRKYLTLLLHEQAIGKARKVPAGKDSQATSSVKENAIAVIPFENRDYTVYGPLEKGLAALMVADLSQVPDIDVADRMQVQMILNETAPNVADQTGATTASRIRDLLKTRFVATGALEDAGIENMQMTSYVSDHQKNGSSGQNKAVGELTRFHELQKKISCDVVNAIGRDCKDMPKSFKKIHTRNLSALIIYSWGLDYLDQAKYDKARERFKKALEKDPEFELAEQALLDTPTSVMAGKPKTQMIAELSQSGLPPTVAGTAVVRSKRWLSTKMIAGAGTLAVVAGGIALSGDGGTSGPGGPSPDPTLKGKWYGTYGSENITMDFGENPSGTGDLMVATSQSEACLGDGSFTFPTGSVNQGDTFPLRLTQTGEPLTGQGECTSAGCITIKVDLPLSEGQAPSGCESNITFTIEKGVDVETEWGK